MAVQLPADVLSTHLIAAGAAPERWVDPRALHCLAAAIRVAAGAGDRSPEALPGNLTWAGVEAIAAELDAAASRPREPDAEASTWDLEDWDLH